MPTYKSRTVLEIFRDIKAFLNLEAGLTRGRVSDGSNEQAQTLSRKLAEKDAELADLRRRLEVSEKATLAGEVRERGGETYEALYEAHARVHSAEDSVGGTFDEIGRLELEVLKREGLRPTDALVDLGCGTGRLAVHAIPFLKGGRYVGIDISESMLEEARKLLKERVPNPPCEVEWMKQTTPVYPLEDGSVDVICAFSVFTHMEHEDNYRYLREALRVVRPGGLFVFSCLPMNLNLAKTVFLGSAAVDLQTRWAEVRNITTSADFMSEVARLAGWEVVRWHGGEEANVKLPDSGEPKAMGQSVCVLRSPEGK